MPDADDNLTDELLLSEMARAIWETELGDYDEPWKDQPWWVQKRWKKMARNALRVFLNKSRSKRSGSSSAVDYCAPPGLLPPPEIIEAAEKVRVWMEQNGYKNWQLGGICDRRFAQAHNDKVSDRAGDGDCS